MQSFADKLIETGILKGIPADVVYAIVMILVAFSVLSSFTPARSSLFLINHL